jgi:hypothetical protein
MDQNTYNTNASLPPSSKETGSPLPVEPPVRKNKKVLWIVGIVVVVILAIVGIRLFIILSHIPTENAVVKNSSSTQPKAANVPGQPVNCAPSIAQCVPVVDLNKDVVPKLQALGYTCTPDTTNNHNQDCKLPGNGGFLQEIVFSNPQGDMTSTHVNSISINSSTQAPGTSSANLASPTWQLNGITFGQVVSTVFAQYPQIQKDLKKWIDGQTGACNYPSIESHDLVDGYQLNCRKATPITISGSGTSVTTWTSIIAIDTPTV